MRQVFHFKFNFFLVKMNLMPPFIFYIYFLYLQIPTCVIKETRHLKANLQRKKKKMEASSTFPLGHLSLLANVGGLKTSQFLSSYRYVLVLHILSFTKLQQSKSNHTPSH